MSHSAKRILNLVPPSAVSSPSVGDKGNQLSAGESPDVVFIIDGDGQILYVNRALPGVSQEDVLGTSIYDYVLPNHHAIVRSAAERVFAGGMPEGFEILGMAHSASNDWYDCRMVPTKRGDRVVSATIIARDVTARKRLESELKQQVEDLKLQLAERTAGLQKATEALKGRTNAMVRREFELARFRELMDRAGEAILITDPSGGKVVDANETACRWLQKTPQELVGVDVESLNLLFPVEPPQVFGDHVTDTRMKRRPKFYKGEHRRQNGSTFPVEVGITEHQFGERSYILVVARDAKGRQLIEEALRESEDKYRALFDLSRDAIYLSNRDGTVAEVNDAALELFGYGRQEFIGFEARSLYKSSADIRAFQKAVAEHGFIREMEVDFVNKDGTVFRGLLTATLRMGGKRNVLGYQCVIRHISDRPRRPAPPSRRSVEAEEARGPLSVLLVEPDDLTRAEVKHVLGLAGIKVLVGESLAEALVIFRSRASEIGAVLLSGSTADILEDAAFTEIRRMRPGARVVLLTTDEPEQAIVEHLAAAGLAGIVRKPFHPLGLIQQVREAAEVGTGIADGPRKRDTAIMPVPPDTPEGPAE
jgi:PAS domain S-box-containing protein